MTDDHNEKFASLDQLCQEATSKNADKIIIHNPVVLGDNYKELIRNLNKIAEAHLAVLILPPSYRGSKPNLQLH